MEAQGKQDIFKINKGLNTDANELGFPDGYSLDERNYELLVDGSRRRRKGLAEESGGSTVALSSNVTLADGDGINTFVWKNVAGDPSVAFSVIQTGNEIYFLADDETPSATQATGSIVLDELAVSGSTTTAAIAAIPAQFSQGRGVLLVSHPLCYPMYVAYDGTYFTANVLKIRIRDFYGIDDGVANQSFPATLTANHEYNLRNRGWVTQDITDYFDDQTVYPAKNQFWYSGYRRQTAAGFRDDDGIQIFSPSKLVAEQFGTSSAPQGSLLLDPLDTTYSSSTSNDIVDAPEVAITALTFTSGNPKDGGTLKVTAVAHGRTTGQVVTISGQQVFTTKFLGTSAYTSFDGSYAITRIDADNFSVTIQPKTGYTFIFDWEYEESRYGQVNGNIALPKSDGEALTVGFRSTAYHAGRAWFAGIESSTYNDTIFFSKVALEPSAFSVCYQEADPTNPEYSQLQSSDGGTIVIPNLGRVQRMLSFRDVLLVFSDNGVWEVGGGRRGLFTADGYSVRKITEAECSSSRGVVAVGNRAIYTGPRGIHILAPNQYTSLLEESSLTENLIQTLWNTIPAAYQQRIKSVYDDALDRVYFLYATAPNQDHFYTYALVLDLRVGAYYKYEFGENSTKGVIGAWAITEADSSNSNKKIKWIYQSTDDDIEICDLDRTTFDDFATSTTEPLPYIITGWNPLGDFQRRGQAPVITVFAKRTETGYTSTGNGFDPINTSSNLMTPFFDWTDHTTWTDVNRTAQQDFVALEATFASDPSVSGKIGRTVETYRNVRGYAPISTSDKDGYPVVTTRNKIRGRGRALQLRFGGATDKDSHILGWTLNTKSTRRK